MKNINFTKNKMPQLSVTAIVVYAVLSGYTYATDDIQFNMDVLDVKERSNVNLKQFAKAGYLMPGDYTFTVNINGQALAGDKAITYYQDEADPENSLPCIPLAVVQEFGLKENVFDKLKWNKDGQCLNIQSLDGLTVTASMATSSLNISIPQAYMEYTSDTWDPPSRWDNGIPGFIFDYNLNAQTRQDNSDYNQGRSNNLSGNGTTGINVGPWRFRADWQGYLNHDAGSDGGTEATFDWTQYYAYRPIASIKSKLTIGETYYNSAIFDSFRFIGGQLESDDSMLPPNLRGYAPEVVGIAKSNAKVTITQKGRVLYQTQVAPGAFRIQDLSDSVTGELDVRVEEQNGDVQTFTVNTSDIPYLTRPGTWRYKVAVGKPEGYANEIDEDDNGHPGDHDYHSDYVSMHDTSGAPMFASGEFSWGIDSGWSLYGGGIGSNEYSALSLGIGRDLLEFGAIAFDTSASWAKLPDEDETKSGTSFRLSYSKDFDDYDSQVTFAGYRFSQRDFMTMDEYLSARAGDELDNDKQKYVISFNKQFRDLGMSVYLNYSHDTYWNRPESNNFNLSASKTFDMFSMKNLSVSLTAYKNQYNGNDDFGGYLSLSVPISDNSTVSFNSSLTNQYSSNELTYHNIIDENNNYQLSTGVSDSDASVRGYYSHLGDMAEIDANASYQAGESTNLGLTLRGGLTATTHGVALHRVNDMGGTRLMVDSDGVADVPVSGFGGISDTNYFGKAIIADVNSYYRSAANIDLDKLNDDTEVTNSVVQATLTEGAIGYRQFHVIRGAKGMAVIRMPDGSSPPFGATVYNKNQQQTGIINEDGNVYLTGMNPGEMMSVRWSEEQCDITLPPVLPTDASKNMLLPCSSHQ